MKYRIKWKSLRTGKTGQGEAQELSTDRLNAAYQVALKLNTEYPDIIHWVEKEPDPTPNPWPILLFFLGLGIAVALVLRWC